MVKQCIKYIVKMKQGYLIPLVKTVGAKLNDWVDENSCTVETYYRVGWMEAVVQSGAQGLGEDVILRSGSARSHATQSEEHSQRRTDAEEVLKLKTIQDVKKTLKNNG